MFCPKCGTLMFPKREKEETFMMCNSCKYIQKNTDIKIVDKSSRKSADIEIVEHDHNVNPIVNAKCKKCGNNKAHTWEIQTRSADEPATKFFRCEKCQFTWRDQS